MGWVLEHKKGEVFSDKKRYPNVYILANYYLHQNFIFFRWVYDLEKGEEILREKGEVLGSNNFYRLIVPLLAVGDSKKQIVYTFEDEEINAIDCKGRNNSNVDDLIKALILVERSLGSLERDLNKTISQHAKRIELKERNKDLWRELEYYIKNYLKDVDIIKADGTEGENEGWYNNPNPFDEADSWKFG